MSKADKLCHASMPFVCKPGEPEKYAKRICRKSIKRKDRFLSQMCRSDVTVSFICPQKNYWLHNIAAGLRKAGFLVIDNKIEKRTDVILAISERSMKTPQEYTLARGNKIPIISIIMDIPAWRLVGASYHPTNKINSNMWLKDRLLHVYFWYLYAVVLKQRLKRCDLVLSLSKKTQEDLLNILGVKSKPCYLYIDTQKFDSVSGISKKNQIVQISRFIPHKKFEHTIKAVGLLKKRYKLVCIGHDGDCSRLQKIASENNVDLEIHYKADDRLLVRKLKESKLLVSPSSFEGLGLTPLEALYCNVPVLLSDITTFREIYGDKVLYHELNNYQEQAEKMEYLLENEDIGAEMVRNTRRIVNNFTLEAAIGRLTGHIESVLSKAPK